MNPNLKKNAKTVRSCASNFFFVVCIILLSMGNYSILRANNSLKISIQVPTSKAKNASSSKPVTKTVVKASVMKKKKMKKVMVKDSVAVEIDPTNSNPPLFQKQ